MGQENNNQVSTEEYINSHISRVQNWINRFTGILFNRGTNHDKSKLKEPEFPMWKKMDQEPRYKYGTKEYNEKINRYKEVFDLHYRQNRHHPEHWSGFYSEMDLIDVIEMLCDWLGYKDDITIKEAEELVNIQCKRYNFNSTLQSLLYNTLKNYFTISENEKSLNELFRKLGINDKYSNSSQIDFEENRHIDIYV